MSKRYRLLKGQSVTLEASAPGGTVAVKYTAKRGFVTLPEQTLVDFSGAIAALVGKRVLFPVEDRSEE